MGKGKKKGAIDVFARLAKYRQDVVSNVDHPGVTPAELADTALIITPAIPRAEVSLEIKFRCSVPIVKGDILQIYLPGFRGKSSFFTPEASQTQNKTSCYQFHGFWSADGSKKKKNGIGKQLMLFKCISRIDAQSLVVIIVPRALGLISPEKLALNSTKIKISGTIKHAEEGKLLKHGFVVCTEIKKRPVIKEIEEYKELITDNDRICGLEEVDIRIAEELSLEEVDQLWEAAHDRCPYPIAFQWHIAILSFHNYDDHRLLFKTIIQNSRGVIKKREALGLQKEIAKNFGVKIGAVILFQKMLTMLYGSLYSELSSSVLLAVRIFTMEPIDIARTFSISDPPQFSLAREVYSCFRTGNKEGLIKWTYTLSMLLFITGGNNNYYSFGGGNGNGDNNNNETISTPLATPKSPILFYGIKELPSEEVQFIRELVEGDWYMFPCFLLASSNLKWRDDETFPIPDGGVLFEIHNVIDTLELSDISMYPYNYEWLLPLCSLFRIKDIYVYEDRNDLTHVILDMQGSLHGAVKDSSILEEDRASMSVIMKNLKLEVEKSSFSSNAIAEHILLNVRLNERYRLDPQTLLRAQYVDHYFEVKRFSEAKRTIEEGIITWQVCISPVQMMDAVEGVIKHAVWEVMPRKFALVTEQCFLSRTRVKKNFEMSGILLDFTNYLCDYAGKGLRPMRRVLKKRVTHEAPLPIFEELPR